MQGIQFDVKNKVDNSNTTSLDNIENLLEKELNTNKLEKWNKIDKTIKYKKLMEYADDKEGEDVIMRDKLKCLLVNSLNENKFTKISDVLYENDKIVSIPSLTLVNGEYILRPIKRQLTSKSLSISASKTRTKRNNKN